MRRFVGRTFLVLAVVGASLWPVALVSAATVTGSPVTIAGLDALNATAQQEAKRGSGKTIATLLGFGGLGLVVAGRVGLGLGGLGAGLGMGFVPGAVSSAFDSAPAATGMFLMPATLEAWWVPLTAALYPLFLVLRLIQDPVVLVPAVCTLYALRLVRLQRGTTTVA